MSAGAHTVTVPPRFQRASVGSGELSETARRLISLATFAALALYGVARWATLMTPAPTWRLLGLAVLAVALAVGAAALRRAGKLPIVVVAAALCLLALPVAGLPWHSFIHLRIAVSVRYIADGLTKLPDALVPYSGPSHVVRLVIALGAAVLLLDAAIVIAFAPPGFGDARRAGAALPLIALAVVPSTLVRPQLPYLQGLVLFALLAAFMWGERLRRDAVRAALVLATLAGVAAAIAAARLDPHKPWVDYRAWAGTLAPRHVDSFDWSQGYGPLHWPRSGHVVMTVAAARGDYWKAQDLDVFNGYGWAPGTVGGPSLPPPDPSSLTRWTQTLKVRIQGMRSSDVIASGSAYEPASVSGGVAPGLTDGTWVAAERPLGPGASYQVRTYSPHPSAAHLSHAGDAYPRYVLDDYRSIRLPQADEPPTVFPQIVFPRFHSSAPVQAVTGGVETSDPVQRSPYGPVYALARQLAARAPTPYAFVTSIERYLAHGYTYNEKPPVRTYPLVSFLEQAKIGYCQQFAGAMALLLRMGGVPARVADGFTAGTHDSATNQWVVTDTDAHAWVEAWFPHYGWVRFDPTPSVAPARSGQPALPAFDKRLPGTGAAGASAPSRQAQSTTGRAGRGPRASGGSASPLLIVPALAVLALLAWLLRSLRRSAPGADDLLDELERALARTGRPLDAGVTLAALERRFHDSPPAAAYVRSLRLARYGGATARPSVPERRALREQLGEGLGLTGRLRALWALPPRPAASRPRRSLRRVRRALKS
ncbi:MAG: transglutaminaseTgpA domain-containing protein [Solirubrobacteraceae bacterium]